MTRRLMSGLSSDHASSTTKNDRSTDDLKVSMLKFGLAHSSFFLMRSQSFSDRVLTSA